MVFRKIIRPYTNCKENLIHEILGSWDISCCDFMQEALENGHIKPGLFGDTFAITLQGVDTGGNVTLYAIRYCPFCGDALDYITVELGSDHVYPGKN